MIWLMLKLNGIFFIMLDGDNSMLHSTVPVINQVVVTVDFDPNQ